MDSDYTLAKEPDQASELEYVQGRSEQEEVAVRDLSGEDLFGEEEEPAVGRDAKEGTVPGQEECEHGQSHGESPNKPRGARGVFRFLRHPAAR